jgi:caa(3)-type oxidase subunit IV
MTSEARRTTAVWVGLLGLTALAVLAARSGAADGHRLATIAVIVIAFFKVRLVGRAFMELRTAVRPLRLVFDAWVVLVCALILGLYEMGG